MKPKEQKIAIAKSCGYALDFSAHTNGYDDFLFTVGLRHNGILVTEKVTRITHYGNETKYEKIACNKKKVKNWNDFLVARPNAIPDYLNDLNAMHGVEMLLTQNENSDQYLAYWETLEKVVGCKDSNKAKEMRKVISATAKQRAEAYLKTLNLWK